MKKFDIRKFDVEIYDGILEKGLSQGMGERDSQVCIEAAICQTLGLPHGDDPHCVAESVRRFKICLNDKTWSSPKARAKGLRDLGLAQLGSKGIVNDVEFVSLLSKKTIQILLPKLLREIFPTNDKILNAAMECEKMGSANAAANAANAAANAANAANAAANAANANAAANAANAAAYAANANAAAYAANAANAANAAAYADKYLMLSASLALDTLRELKSPGVILLDEKAS